MGNDAAALEDGFEDGLGEVLVAQGSATVLDGPAVIEERGETATMVVVNDMEQGVVVVVANAKVPEFRIKP